jgi:hypothetical protein
MAIVSPLYRNIVVSIAILNAFQCNPLSSAFSNVRHFAMPRSVSNARDRSTFLTPQPVKIKNQFQNKYLARSIVTRESTLLRMAADDFNESKYTEAAWSAIATLTKAADYYEASTIEAPILVDILLNPQKLRRYYSLLVRISMK